MWAELHTGATVGQYAVEALLGRGGMAVVYRVRHLRLGTPHALKVVTLSSTDMHRRLLQEGRAQGALRHPNVVAVTDTVEIGGALGLVMELVEGPSLDRLLSERRLSLEQADALAQAILSGVVAAHRAGLVHRDLKPANILLQVTRGGFVPKIADFGLAKVLDGSSEADTRSGVGMGTPPYMAPEQIRRAKSADARADVFSLGAILYELVTGERAFAGDDMFEVFVRINQGEYGPLDPELPERMARAITGALTVDRERRIQSAEALLAVWTDLDEPTEDDCTWGRELLDAAREWTSEADLPVSPPTEARTFTDEVEPPPPAPTVTVSGAPPRPPAPLPVPVPSRRRWIPATAALAVAGAALAMHPRAPEPTLWPHTTPLAADDALLLGPSMRADGAAVVYERDGEIVRLGEGPPAVLTEGFGPPARQPAYSPDGTRIAFASDDGVYVMGASGDAPVRVLDHGFHPAWSPDGQRLAVVAASTPDPFQLDGAGGLEIVELETGLARALPAVDARGASWSPDGRRLVFWDGRRDVHLLPLDGGPAVPVATDPAVGEWSPVFAPDGRGVLFLSERAGAVGLWRVPVGEQGASGPPVAVTRGDLGAVWSFTTSADGRRLALSSVRTTSALLRVRDGAVAEIARSHRPWLSASVSPDGSQVAFDARGEREDVFVLPIEGGEPRPLTRDAWRDRAPQWSPDGTEILFYSNRGGGAFAAWSVRPDGSGLRRRTTGEGLLTYPRFSADGLEITAFSAEAGGTAFFTATTGEPARPPLPGAFATSWGAGDRVLVNSERGVGVWDPVTRSRIDIGAWCRWPEWLPGEDAFVCVTDDALLRVSADGERLDELASVAPMRFPDPDPVSVSADGRTIVLSALEQRGELWRVDLVGPHDGPAPDLRLTRLSADPAPQRDPALSADGERIAWVERGAVHQRRLGGPVERLDGPADPTDPDFSADGRLVVAGADGLYVLGTGRVHDSGFQPDFSPDGRRLLFAGAAGPNGRPIRTLVLETGAVRDLGLLGEHPRWSPDGERLVYADPSGHLWTARSDGTDPIRVTVDADIARGAPAWAPGGEALYFLSDALGTRDVWRVPVSDGRRAGRAAPVTAGSRGELRGLAAAGGRLACEVGFEEGDGDLWVIDLGG